MSQLTNPILASDQVHQMIPQKSPMVMIDQLLEHDEVRSLSSFDILSDNIFCSNNLFTEPGLIENVAQTAAIRAGYLGIQKAQKQGVTLLEPVLGYIASVKNCSILKLPAVGSRIYTEIIVEREVLSVSLIRAKVFNDTDLFLECEMKIFQKG